MLQGTGEPAQSAFLSLAVSRPASEKGFRLNSGGKRGGSALELPVSARSPSVCSRSARALHAQVVLGSPFEGSAPPAPAFLVIKHANNVVLFFRALNFDVWVHILDLKACAVVFTVYCFLL